MEPYTDRPTEGFMRIDVSLSVNAEQCNLSDSDIRTILEKTIKESDAIDLESLCVIAGEQVWDIKCDLRVVDYNGGNIIDASLLATMAALRAYRKAEVSIESLGVEASGRYKTKVHVFSSTEREPLPLALHHTPLAASIGLFRLQPQHLTNKDTNSIDNSFLIQNSKNNNVIAIVCDPSLDEELTLDGSLCISINAHK